MRLKEYLTEGNVNQIKNALIKNFKQAGSLGPKQAPKFKKGVMSFWAQYQDTDRARAHNKELIATLKKLGLTQSTQRPDWMGWNKHVDYFFTSKDGNFSVATFLNTTAPTKYVYADLYDLSKYAGSAKPTEYFNPKKQAYYD